VKERRSSVGEGKLNGSYTRNRRSRLSGRIDTWFAVTPDDSFIFLRIVAGHEVYGLSYGAVLGRSSRPVTQLRTRTHSGRERRAAFVAELRSIEEEPKEQEYLWFGRMIHMAVQAVLASRGPERVRRVGGETCQKAFWVSGSVPL
jgi:hypothetical protein